MISGRRTCSDGLRSAGGCRQAGRHRWNRRSQRPLL
jgi:hypothetical protein